MQKIPFTVSARTARLIGRENVANATGAIIELVKNTYDADAKICVIYFSQPFQQIPGQLTKEQQASLPTDDEFIQLLDECYTETSIRQLKREADPNLFSRLERRFQAIRVLFVIDNGTGMDRTTIIDQWMTIGTANKETQSKSLEGRVKSGAKGIGRFALDRLGSQGLMITKPQGGRNDFVYVWSVDWDEFERPGAKLDEINASLEKREGITFSESLFERIKHQDLLEVVNEGLSGRDAGTLLRISKLRDEWDHESIADLRGRLQKLIPPKWLSDFKIALFCDGEELENQGWIESKEFDDYDYKVDAHYDAKEKIIHFDIDRWESDVQRLEQLGLFTHDEMQKSPFDKATFTQRTFCLEKKVDEILPGESKDQPTLDRIGSFRMSFIYAKKGKRSIDTEKYAYRQFKSEERKDYLDQFGGIKIFRDGFLVRPYGEKDSSSFDWLGLDERSYGSPAVYFSSAWRVANGPIAGAIFISRHENKFLVDKSSREGLQENNIFHMFKQMVLGIIRVFEDDRSKIASVLHNLHDNEREKRSFARRNEISEAVKNAKDLEKFAETFAGKPEQIDVFNTLIAPKINSIVKVFGEFDKIKKEHEDEVLSLGDEIRILRGLASSGLLVASFAHEFYRMKNQLKSRNQRMRKAITKYVSEIEASKSIPNPYEIIGEAEKTDEKILQWVDFSILSIQQNRRKKKHILLKEYLSQLQSSWRAFMNDRQIEFKIFIPEEIHKRNPMIWGFEIDLDTIFENLIANSITQFLKPLGIKNREIRITLESNDAENTIYYQDNGGGLDPSIINPDDIFKQHFTTKVNKKGERIGTGLGMWLVRQTTDSYKNCRSELFFPENGFGFKIVFSTLAS